MGYRSKRSQKKGMGAGSVITVGYRIYAPRAFRGCPKEYTIEEIGDFTVARKLPFRNLVQVASSFLCSSFPGHTAGLARQFRRTVISNPPFALEVIDKMYKIKNLNPFKLLLKEFEEEHSESFSTEISKFREKRRELRRLFGRSKEVGEETRAYGRVFDEVPKYSGERDRGRPFYDDR